MPLSPLNKTLLAAALLALAAWAFRGYLSPEAAADFINSRVLCE